jgi:hypothetical protein
VVSEVGEDVATWVSGVYNDEVVRSLGSIPGNMGRSTLDEGWGTDVEGSDTVESGGGKECEGKECGEHVIAGE